MMATKETWLVQKRVANTDYWGTVSREASREAAISRARTVEGGQSTGVRIFHDAPHATPEIVIGC